MSQYQFRSYYATLFALPIVVIFLISALILNPHLLSAYEQSDMRIWVPIPSFPAVSDESLAQKKLIDTGWECGNPNRSCTHILINDSESLLCIPAEIKDDSLMIPLDHFRYIGGCGLETGADGSLHLIRNNRVYMLYADSPLLVCEDKTLIFPIAPYEAHGFLYVPLRFLCEALDMGIQWRAQSDAVVLHSLWTDAGQIAGPLTTLNQTLLAAFAEEEWSAWFERLEPVDIAVTFYSSDRNPPYTASGYIAEAGSLAADSRIPYGTQYYIPELAMIKEDAIFTVHDRGGAVTGDLLDVFVPAHLQSDPAVYAVLRRGRFKTEGYRIHSEG